MAFKTPAFVQETSSSPGTGNFVLNGAPTGRQTFAGAGIAAGDTFPYAAVSQSTGAREQGIGTFTAGGQITRSPRDNNGNVVAATNLTGTVDVYVAMIPALMGNIRTDTVDERTSGAGVTLDGVLLKDGGVTATALSTLSSVKVGATGTVKTGEFSATASLTFGGGSIAAGAGANETIAVAGAAPGDEVTVTPDSVSRISQFAWTAVVGGIGSVTLRIVNRTAGTVSAPSGTWRVTVSKYS
ncbi:hypothetical protein ACM64Y_00675 [Novispirillum sp. DQ9]|uniref:hypothetical protein n=1 Tax=Novispirillum sp. DQ9 TaxID=3398612 RepID=UPI003C7D70E8